jgi:membrane associated rhomboid family serine protease
VGASGAIFGLMGALVAVAVDRKIDLVRSGLLGSVGFALVFTFLVPNISIGGHLGGLAGGFLAGLVATKGARLMGRRAELVSSAVIVAGGLACGLAAYVLMQARYG